MCCISQSSSSQPSEQWEDVRAYDSGEQLEALLPFRSHLALLGRHQGQQQLWVADAAGPGPWREVALPEQAYSLWFGDNCDFHSEWLRLGYSSLVTPKQVLDCHLPSGKLLVRSSA
jgi:oligopeptidase B